MNEFPENVKHPCRYAAPPHQHLTLFHPGQDSIGKRVTWGTPEMGLPWLTVVGMIGDVHQAAPNEKLFPNVYESYLQGAGYSWVRKMNLALRTGGDPLALANAVRKARSAASIRSCP